MNLEKINTYMNMAREIAKLSPDEETKVGAIMLSPEDRIIASSYNGFLRKANDKKLPRTRPEKYQYIQHAERNMIYNCAYEGIKTKDTTIVCTLSPCLECLRACFQAGVKTIIFDKLYGKFDNLEFYEQLEDMIVHIGKAGDYTILSMDTIVDY